ncbi:hypothetical protein [Marmoricola sp. RAF53]|uniref:hypothetical protein n=1 Tax=Marmoricola sp. RAF53 TaxID=3233059 RepID=UPI003F974C80
MNFSDLGGTLVIALAVAAGILTRSVFESRRRRRRFDRGVITSAFRQLDASGKRVGPWRRGATRFEGRTIIVGNHRLDVISVEDVAPLEEPSIAWVRRPAFLFDIEARAFALQTTRGPVVWAVPEPQADAAGARLGL